MCCDAPASFILPTGAYYFTLYFFPSQSSRLNHWTLTPHLRYRTPHANCAWKTQCKPAMKGTIAPEAGLAAKQTIRAGEVAVQCDDGDTLFISHGVFYKVPICGATAQCAVGFRGVDQTEAHDMPDHSRLHDECLNCPLGYTSPKGSTKCFECEVGKYGAMAVCPFTDEENGATKCNNRAGALNLTRGSCLQCPPGMYQVS